MKTTEITRKLKAAGCYILRNGGNHDIWFSPITGNKFAVHRHKMEMPTGTQKQIEKQSGVKF